MLEVKFCLNLPIRLKTPARVPGQERLAQEVRRAFEVQIGASKKKS